MKTPEEKTGSLPLTDGEREAEGMVRADGLKVIIDDNMVSVPITRYDELVEAEAKLGVAYRAFKTLESYNVKAVLGAIFGEKVEDDNA